MYIWLSAKPKSKYILIPYYSYTNRWQQSKKMAFLKKEISKNYLTRYPKGVYKLDRLTRKSGLLMRNQARAIEQAVYNRMKKKGIKAVNKPNVNNPIDANHAHFDAAVKWGEDWLNSNGFGGLFK